MRIMKHHDENPGSPLVCFAEIVCRDPFSIVGRYPNSGFRLADLARMRIATVSEVPTPWLCLQQDLRQAGIDPTELDRVADRNMAENLLALREGRIDAAQFFEPVVEEALASAGHLWHAASICGRTTYTAFVTTRDRLVRDAEPLLRMVRAIHRAQQRIHACSAAELAAAVSPYFPALDSGVLTGALARYQAQGVWGRDPVLPEDGFDRLQNSLVSSGFTRRPVPYAACVDNRFARWVLAV
jgi:NitT/TauT family transport system substrate-binding protein